MVIRACWAWLTPSLCGVLGLASFYRICDGAETYEGAEAPAAASVVGFFLMLAPVVVMALGAVDARPEPAAEPGVELAAPKGSYV